MRKLHTIIKQKQEYWTMKNKTKAKLYTKLPKKVLTTER